MRLQAEAGDRAGAVSTYHHCASVLERELGVEPDIATYRAFQRLMAPARPAAGPAAGGSAGRPGAAGTRLSGGPASSPCSRKYGRPPPRDAAAWYSSGAGRA